MQRLTPSNSIRQILTFLGITVCLTLGVELFMQVFQPPPMEREHEYFILGITWSPALAALLTMYLYRLDLNQLGWNTTKRQYYLWSYFIPMFYSLGAYLLTWGAGLGKFYDESAFQVLANHFGMGQWPVPIAFAGVIAFSATLGWLHGCLLALGEEIGWRGFLVPQLSKILPFGKTAILSGFIWAIWHYPVVIFGGYNDGTPIGYSLICFTLTIVAISIPLAWLRLKSGSLWTGVIFHSSHNLFILDLWNPLTKDTGVTKYIISEFGIALVLTTWICAYLFWQQKDRLSQAINSKKSEREVMQEG
jgi:uncharacterized protein